MFCKNCEAKMPDDFEFCGKCGHPANEEPKSTKPTFATKKPKKRTGLIVAVVILSVLFAISGAILAFMVFTIVPRLQDGSLFSGLENTFKEAVSEQMEGMAEGDVQEDSNNEEGMLAPSVDVPEEQEGEMANLDSDVEAADTNFLVGDWRETGIQVDPWGLVDEPGQQFAQEQLDTVASYRSTYENYTSGLIFYEDGTFVTMQYENDEPFAYKWYWWDISDSNELVVGTGDEFPGSETPNWTPGQLDLMQDFQNGDYSAFDGSPYWLVRIERHGNKLYWYLPSTDALDGQEVVCSVIERNPD
jgi:hypothetical protein